MHASQRSHYLSLLGWSLLLFALITYKGGVLVASVVLASGLVGYFNVFAAFRAGIAVAQRKSITYLTTALAIASLLATAVLSSLGYWAVVGLCTGSWLVIDGIALRFSGPPVGGAARGP